MPAPTASYDYTVRPDGKRTALNEQHWFDESGIGFQPVTSTYSWQYDDLNRLTDEVIDHWDDTYDQTESFTYDLAGNRTQLDRDKGNNGTIDEAITYSYDANDRLLDEVLDSIVGTDDTTTSYTYDHTQQTAKVVFAGIGSSPRVAKSSQLFSYNLQGRMTSVTNEGYTTGTLSTRDRTSYEHNSKSYRISLITETGTTLSTDAQSEIYTPQSSITFLADSHNHTGYTQTIRETKVENGHTLITDYTFGHDEISQRVHGNDSTGTAIDQTHIFGHDGHGSVRILYDLQATITALATYSAYGILTATHNALGGIHTSPFTQQTSLGYSGEHFDNNTQQQYLRARFYSPTTGRFNRLDSFGGSMQDPQSLHKYAYTSGDPVLFSDPTGLYEGLSGLVSSIGNTLAIAAQHAPGIAWTAARAVPAVTGRLVVNGLFPIGTGSLLLANASSGAFLTHLGATYLLRVAISAAISSHVVSRMESISPPLIRELRELASVADRVLDPTDFLISKFSSIQPGDSVRSQINAFADKIEQFVSMSRQELYGPVHLLVISQGGGVIAAGSGLTTVTQFLALMAAKTEVLNSIARQLYDKSPAAVKQHLVNSIGFPNGTDSIKFHPNSEAFSTYAIYDDPHPEREVQRLKFAIDSINTGEFENAAWQIDGFFRELSKYGVVTVNGAQKFP